MSRKHGHYGGRTPRATKPAYGQAQPRRPYTVRKATAEEIAESVAFDNGLGNGSASEYANILEAARRGFAEGLAEGQAKALSDVQRSVADPGPRMVAAAAAAVAGSGC